MAQAPATEQQTSEAEAQPADQQANASSANNIRFIQSLLTEAFTEENAKKLFAMYVLDESDDKLQPPDVRKMLLDLLEASQWPLVCPDEALDAVLHELCLNDKGAITWVEFKSFFVFLQDRPLTKLFDIVTKSFTREQLNMSRLVELTPIETIENPSFDRSPFKQAIADIIPKAGPIFIYFLGGGSALALVLGAFEGVFSDEFRCEVMVSGVQYAASIRAFNAEQDVFPPIQRAGGLASKVSRKIADTYLLVMRWDSDHLQVFDKTAKLVKATSEKLLEVDQQLAITEKTQQATTATVEAIRAFDEKHQVSRRLSDTAKGLNEKYQLSEKFGAAFTKVKQNEYVSKGVDYAKSGMKTIEDINKETKQLVSEKELESKEKEDESESVTPQVEGVSDTQSQPNVPIEATNDEPPLSSAAAAQKETQPVSMDA